MRIVRAISLGALAFTSSGNSFAMILQCFKQFHPLLTEVSISSTVLYLLDIFFMIWLVLFSQFFMSFSNLKSLPCIYIYS